MRGECFFHGFIMGAFPEHFPTRRALEKIKKIFSGFGFQPVKNIGFGHRFQGLVAPGAA
jgi:hypothetical protein